MTRVDDKFADKIHQTFKTAGYITDTRPLKVLGEDRETDKAINGIFNSCIVRS